MTFTQLVKRPKNCIKIVVTGSTGYIGRRVVLAALKAGHDVVSASRRLNPYVAHLIHWIPFDLTTTSSITFPPGTEAVIHMAADTSSRAYEKSELEINAAKLLLDAAQKIGAKFIFVSSQTARPDAPTAYGRTKWLIEQDVLAAGGWVIRPGLVYGGNERGLFGTLVGAVRRLPLLPCFVPKPKIQPIHVDDLAAGLLRLAERDDIPPGVLCLGSQEPDSFSQFLSNIASYRLRCKRWFIPVPVILVKATLAILGSKFSSRFGIDRLLSLFELPVMETARDLQQLELPLRPLQSGMHRSGDNRRRRFLTEGRLLMTYILKEKPGFNLLSRYVRAIETIRGGFPLDLPDWAMKFSFAIGLFENSTFILSEQRTELAWRLDVATALAEATTKGARRFLGIGQHTDFLRSLLNICHAVIAEGTYRLIHSICKPLLWYASSEGKGQR